MSTPFQVDAYTRDLPRKEILERGLPLRWWAEHTKDLLVHIHGIQIVVPTGFLTDGASIPRIIWSILSDTDPDILYPSYPHDLLYTLQGRLSETVILTRDESDQIIRDLMVEIGAPKWKADQVYFQLRLWGWVNWNKPDQKKLLSIQNKYKNIKAE